MTKRDDRQRDFETRLRERLAHEVDDIDGEALRRLQSARRAALDKLDGPTSRAGYWLPAGAVAATVAVFAVVLIGRQGDVAQQAPPGELVARADDLEIMVAGEDLELIEDLEFFEWLDPEGDPG